MTIDEIIKHYEQVLKELKAYKEQNGDCINRQAMHIELEKWITYGEYKYSNATKYLYDRIDRLPSVTLQPETGRWILTHRNGVNMYICSECNNEPLLIGESYPIFKLSGYCPYCGAKMEVEE